MGMVSTLQYQIYSHFSQGEPLNNYRNVLSAIELIQTRLSIGSRHITISTVGIVPKIKQLARDNGQVDFILCFTSSYSFLLLAPVALCDNNQEEKTTIVDYGS